MTARDWLESIRADVVELVGMEYELEEIETKLGPHGQRMGSIGGTGDPDKLRPIDSLVDSRLREKLESKRDRVNRRIEHALHVLYGESGRGGLARARSSLDADILCAYYLQGESWSEIASGVASFNPARPNGWCRQRAMRALEYIDSVGRDVLADS